MLMAIACGPSGTGGDGDGDGDQGDSCETATNCAGDLVCDPDTNECVADKPCTGHAECGNGGHCNTGTGFCAPSQTGSPCDADVSCQEGEACVGAGGANGGFCGCDGEQFEATPVEPNMLIVLDRSGSMLDDGGGGTSKWDHAGNALGQLMTDYGDQIRFGLAQYPEGNNSCDDGAISEDIAANNGAAVLAALDDPSDNNPTPLEDALQETVIGYQGLLDPDRPNYTLIINDGAPNCGPGGSNDFDDPSPRVTELFNMGILSFVIGFGDGVNPNVLNDMAEAGGTAKAGAEKYYQADNAADLQMALDEIGGSVLACSFTLNADAEAQVFVYGDGMPLEFMYDRDTMTVTVLGVDCDSLRIGDITELVVVNSCPIGVD
jgi:hypothetical protein